MATHNYTTRNCQSHLSNPSFYWLDNLSEWWENGPSYSTSRAQGYKKRITSVSEFVGYLRYDMWLLQQSSCFIQMDQMWTATVYKRWVRKRRHAPHSGYCVSPLSSIAINQRKGTVSVLFAPENYSSLDRHATWFVWRWN